MVSSSLGAGRRVCLGAQSEASLLGFEDEESEQQRDLNLKEIRMRSAYRSVKGVCRTKVNCSRLDL